MNPYKYTTDSNGKITFHYHHKDVKYFLAQGALHGAMGMLLMSVTKEKRTTYRGFGTIENPSKVLTTMVLTYNPLYDAPIEPELVLNPPPPWYANGTYRLEIIEFP